MKSIRLNRGDPNPPRLVKKPRPSSVNFRVATFSEAPCVRIGLYRIVEFVKPQVFAPRIETVEEISEMPMMLMMRMMYEGSSQKKVSNTNGTCLTGVTDVANSILQSHTNPPGIRNLMLNRILQQKPDLDLTSILWAIE